MVVVSLAAATICFANACFPALMGKETPAGTYTLRHQKVDAPGYGGDILVYRENARHVWAIHRVYTLNPAENRVARLHSGRAELRRAITKGCINVMPEVYERLVACCSGDVLVINE